MFCYVRTSNGLRKLTVEALDKAQQLLTLLFTNSTAFVVDNDKVALTQNLTTAEAEDLALSLNLITKKSEPVKVRKAKKVEKKTAAKAKKTALKTKAKVKLTPKKVEKTTLKTKGKKTKAKGKKVKK